MPTAATSSRRHANYNGPVPVVTYSLTDGSSTDTSTLNITRHAGGRSVHRRERNREHERRHAAHRLGAHGHRERGRPGDGRELQRGRRCHCLPRRPDRERLRTSARLVINADGTYTFTPAANYNGPVPAGHVQPDRWFEHATPRRSPSRSRQWTTRSPTRTRPSASNEDTTLTGSVLTGTTSVDGNVSVTSFTVAGSATVYLHAGQTATIANVGTLAIDGRRQLHLHAR
jgi:hypothetical protein